MIAPAMKTGAAAAASRLPTTPCLMVRDPVAPRQVNFLAVLPRMSITATWGRDAAYRISTIFETQPGAQTPLTAHGKLGLDLGTGSQQPVRHRVEMTGRDRPWFLRFWSFGRGIRVCTAMGCPQALVIDIGPGGKDFALVWRDSATRCHRGQFRGDPVLDAIEFSRQKVDRGG